MSSLYLSSFSSLFALRCSKTTSNNSNNKFVLQSRKPSFHERRRLGTRKKASSSFFSTEEERNDDDDDNNNDDNDKQQQQQLQHKNMSFNSMTTTSSSPKEKQLLRKLLLEEGQSLTKARKEDKRLKKQVEKRKKKIVLNASEVGSIRMPSELFGMRRVKVPGMFDEGEEEEEEAEREGEEDETDNGHENGNRLTQTSTMKKKGVSSLKGTNKKRKSGQRRKILYSASECSDFGQRFPIDSIVVVDPESRGEETICISDFTLKTFLRDAVELLPQCAPFGLQFGDFRSAVSQSYDSNEEDKESCFRGDVCYRFLKTKRNEEKIVWHPISFERKERTKEEKEFECNLESNDGWPFAFRLSLTEDKKYLQLEMRLFWPKNELLKYGKEALERDGKHRFDVFAKNVESMLYYMERGVIGRSALEDGNGVKKEQDSSDVVKELSQRMKRRLGRAPFVTEIARELERL
jgi:hypothetical protein